MENRKVKVKRVVPKQLHVRKLTKAGGSRYLSIGTIFPPEWQNVKIIVEDMNSEGCILRIQPIK